MIRRGVFGLLLASCLSVAASQKVISIVGTADLQGLIEPTKQKIDLNGTGTKEEVMMGGIANLANVYAGLKQRNPNTIVVSVGDDLMNRFFHVYKGKAILSLISDAGYDLYALGNHEFDKGSKVLAGALEGQAFTTVCTDLDVSASALKGKCVPYEIRELDGVKVGFFSVMTADLPLVTSERDVKLSGDSVTVAKNMVAELKAKGADVIVLLSHIGYKEDVALAKQVRGIDLIFGGHSHEYVKVPGHIHETSIVNGGEKGTIVVKVDIPLDENNTVLSDAITMEEIPVIDSGKGDTKITAKITEYKKSFPAAVVLGSTEGAWDLRSGVIRKGESTVADLVNDLMRKKFGVEIVLNNSGAFRGSKIYPEGNITDEMLKEIDEFGNYAYTLKLKGKYFKEILERSAACYGEGGLMQPSGLRYRIKLPGNVQKIDGEKVVAAGSRVSDIEVLENGKWVAVDPEREYTVLSNSFIVNHNGDGYYWFSKYGTDPKNTYTTFYTIMAEFIETHKVLTPPAADGRLVIEQ